MQILLDEPYETTPEDLYPIVQNLINQLLVKWDFLWIDNPQLRIQPDLLTEIVELDGGMKTVTQRQVQSIPGKGKIFSEPKTVAGRRPLKLGEGVLQKLRIHKEQQAF